MKKFNTTQAISRLSIALAIIVPLIFIGVVILKNQQIPAGFEIIKFGGIMLAIAVAVWLSIRITALLSNILIDWLDKLLAKGKNKNSQDDSQQENNGFQPKVIDAEIVEEEVSEGVWQKGNGQSGNGTVEPDWAKATSDPHSALSMSSQQKAPEKRKRIVGPPSRLSKTIMVVLFFAILFGLISNLMSDVWLTLLAPIPGLWAIISLWRIWDPKNTPPKSSIQVEDQNHSYDALGSPVKHPIKFSTLHIFQPLDFLIQWNRFYRLARNNNQATVRENLLLKTQTKTQNRITYVFC